MHTLTVEDLKRDPEQVLDDARNGQAGIVLAGDEAVLLTLPLGPASGDGRERTELAVSLYERELVSLGLAAKVAGLSYSEMVDELGRRLIPVVRYDDDDLARELAYVRGLAGSR